MFEEQLLDFYLKKLNIWNLVYKDVRKQLFSVVSIFVLVLTGFLVFIYLNNSFRKYILFDPFYASLLYFLVYMILFIFCMYLFVFRLAISTCIIKYNISFKSKHWKVFIYLMIQSYLYDRKILGSDSKLNEKSLDFLINALKERKEEVNELSLLNNLSSYFALFFLLAVPVWSAFNGWIYNHGGIDDLGKAIWYLATMISIIAISVFSIWMPIKVSLLEELFCRKSSKILYLIKALESIKFSLENPNYVKTETPGLIKQSIINSIVKENNK